MDAFGNPDLMHNKEFELQDFIDDPNFDQFVDIIREEKEDPVPTFDCRIISGCCVDDNYQFGSYSTTPYDMFGFNGASKTVSDLFLNSSLSSLNADVNEGDPDEEDNEGDHSSGTIRKKTTTSNRQSKADRSRTLISERRRRGRMKEKLYALRALVPNITKMDKASIIGDAVLYVQELQNKAKKLKAEVAGLEASSGGSHKYQESIAKTKKIQVRSNNRTICKKRLMQMDVFQVEERGFYLKLVCNKGDGVAVSLYKTLESLTSFNVQNSNLATESERIALTLTLKVRDNEQSIHLQNLKLWVTSALLNQGFDIPA